MFKNFTDLKLSNYCVYSLFIFFLEGLFNGWVCEWKCHSPLCTVLTVCLFCDLGGFPCSSEMRLHCVVSAVVPSTVCGTPSVCERETEREGMSRAL